MKYLSGSYGWEKISSGDLGLVTVSQNREEVSELWCGTVHTTRLVQVPGY